MKKRYLLKLLAGLTALLILPGCAQQPAFAPAETAEPTAPAVSSAPAPVEPSATPQPGPTANRLAGAYGWLVYALGESMPVLSDRIPLDEFASEAPLPDFDSKAADYAWLFDLANGLPTVIESALDSAAAYTAERYGLTASTEASVEGPSWQLLYALIRSCADAASFDRAILSALDIKADMSTDGSTLLFNISAAPLNYREVFKNMTIDTAEYIGRCFAYEYLYTVYGETGQEKEYVLPAEEGNFISGFTWPLASHTNLRKTWYAARDGGKRKHTGTDIWAKGGTDIYSCTDGTVTFVGYTKRAGNEVIVEDGYGYVYQYCHMKTLTDFLKEGDAVKAGEKVGIVGSTGNSARNHLHLTIVAPDGVIIDPYTYLAAVEPVQ